jgi:CRISPR-associated protein Cas5a/b/c
MYLIITIRAPLISIKRLDVYQVALTYPFLPPSSIIGSIAFSMSVLGLCEPANCLTYIRNLITHAREFFIKDYRVTFSPFILKRFRKVLEEKRLPKNPDEITKFSDALVREYTYSQRRFIILNIKDKVDIIKEAIFLIERIGDTESLISIEDVREEDAEECNKSINTVMHASRVSNAKGKYTLIKAYDEKGRLENFAVPLYLIGDYYEVGEIECSNSLCVGDAVIPRGDDW